MKIRVGDKVQVIAGKDKGKQGEVLQVLVKENRVIVEGVNVQTKHAKATRNAGAEIKHIEGPIDASNVMLYDAKAKEVIKVAYEVRNGKKVRVSKKTGNVID